MRSNMRPSSKKKDIFSSPSNSTRALPKIQSDESIFKSFYENLPNEASSDGETELEKLVKDFETWATSEDRVLRECCGSTPLLDKCSVCQNLCQKQQKVVQFAVTRLHEKILLLISPHLTAQGVSDVFSDTQTRSDLLPFLQRLVKYMQIWYDQATFGVHSNVGLYSLIFSYLYLKDLKIRKHIQVTYFNVFNLLSVGMVVASKWMVDKIILNNWWSKVCQVDSKKMNKMEIEFCMLFDFNLDVDIDHIIEVYFQIIPNLRSILDEVTKF